MGSSLEAEMCDAYEMALFMDKNGEGNRGEGRWGQKVAGKLLAVQLATDRGGKAHMDRL